MFSPETTDALALLILAALAALLAARLWALRRRLPLTLAQSFWYGVNIVLTKVLWRVRVRGALSLPPGQGAVIACNHRSPIDPCFIQASTARPVYWMVAKEYCNHWTLRWFLCMAEVIPTNRGGIDTAATKAAIRHTQRGAAIGLFPEGRINTTDRLLLPGRLGVALIALRARVPIVPCYVHGSPFAGTTFSPFLMPAQVDLFIGEPIDISEFYGREGEREVLEDVTRRILRQIARLAGHPEIEPELARRSNRAERAAESAAGV